ncbi:MAG: hypothetical protein UY70_C0027G0012 [Candidatus Kaiserbacteria bacterium GW2011_GWB1_52_6]|uniref:Addiction module toxin RelE n=3 Tax=Candidatus Kaiseribacteriota TaxID=1752734 RepID=A0A0G2AF31_9BACT|nr:MAG: hypothetical protein UY67_C0026G0012 [Candidatus Kaiserbacteria bacterium GW2011_GWA2_52_12]KKW26356.1 MAG: hypothetical protein UY70_C0027G0012 [Candidatus Kaiserbacteria bacterium GW2011_GWB1_52_6]KKW31099.1 MAG: hypothetical protein UY74_C0023G0010 [Candidatus Kaiserbacteria bacterium GW2011_GWC2_52_8b]
MSSKYAVVIESFAERHFIKFFAKKYKKNWDLTMAAIEEEMQRIDALIGQTNIAETIISENDVRIVKTEFRVVGTQDSRHTSGNRCIVAVHDKVQTARVLLVYGKTDVRGSRETDWWKGLIRNNYLQYRAWV